MSKALRVTAFKPYIYSKVFLELGLQQVALFIQDSLVGHGKILKLLSLSKTIYKFSAGSQPVKLAEHR